MAAYTHRNNIGVQSFIVTIYYNVGARKITTRYVCTCMFSVQYFAVVRWGCMRRTNACKKGGIDNCTKFGAFITMVLLCQEPAEASVL